jgi:hypothetical protein
MATNRNDIRPICKQEVTGSIPVGSMCIGPVFPARVDLLPRDQIVTST